MSHNINSTRHNTHEGVHHIFTESPPLRTMLRLALSYGDPDSKVYGANMGPTWGRQDPGGSHVGPMNLAIWGGGGTATIWLSCV